MKMKGITNLLAVLVAMAIGTSSGWAAKKKGGKKPQAPQAQLTAAGQKLEAEYTRQMDALKADITKALPTLDQRKKDAYLKAREAEGEAEAALKAVQQREGAIKKAQALVAHAKGKWIGGADKGIAAANAKLMKAKTDAERKAAEAELAKWEKNRKDGLEALEERQAMLDEAERDQPKIEKDLKEAEEALAKAKDRTTSVMKDLGLKSLLSSDKLDGELAKFEVLMEATPRGLADFAQQGEAQRKLIDRMLADKDLLVQMAVADGAKGGNYGRAMEIYRDIQKASDKAAEGTLQRLALAVALEHAVPVKQRNAESGTDAPATVDPVKRYLHYEKAFLDGELDPGLQEPERLGLPHGRRWRGARRDPRLGPRDAAQLPPRPDHHSRLSLALCRIGPQRCPLRLAGQQIRRGQPAVLPEHPQEWRRLRSARLLRPLHPARLRHSRHGPSAARPRRARPLDARWLGALPRRRLGQRLDQDPLQQGPRFPGDHAGACHRRAFMQVKRAQWIGDVMGEPRSFGLLSGEPAFWNSVALYTQRAIIEASKAKTLDAVGQDIAEANETKEKIRITKVKVSDDERKIRVDKNGAITIPAAATSKPTSSTGKIIFMDSDLGGKQLHYSRNGSPQDFEYTFDAPAAGKYALTARVVTPSWQQSLLVTANDSSKPVEISLPFTVGMWDKTQPVEIELKNGKNVLRFSHTSEGKAKGFSIKDFTLTPVGS